VRTLVGLALASQQNDFMAPVAMSHDEKIGGGPAVFAAEPPFVVSTGL
jgi:hypothetical protein